MDAMSSSSDTVLKNVLLYKGEHSVTFTKDGISRNTWNNWGLIPSSRHVEPLDNIWSKEVTVPGVNGQEDLVRSSPYISVNSYYNLRSALLNDNPSKIKSEYGYDITMPTSGALSFVIADQKSSYISKVQEIANFLHGCAVTMVFSDNPSQTYTVRTTVESITSDQTYGGVSISYAIIG